MRFRHAFAVALLATSHGAPAQESSFPLSHMAMRMMLEQANDPALRAQEQHFPEHYDSLIAQLIELKRQEDPKPASLALVQASRQNWARYNELVRQGDPADWRALLAKRRDLFALIRETDGAELCLAYEYQGTQALAASGNPAYHEPVSTYIELFIQAAARARLAPRQWRNLRAADLDLLRTTREAQATDPELTYALRPGSAAHPRFCEAMIATLDAAHTLDGESGALVWRFLVTTGDRVSQN